jgi:hypothetical protein
MTELNQKKDQSKKINTMNSANPSKSNIRTLNDYKTNPMSHHDASTDDLSSIELFLKLLEAKIIEEPMIDQSSSEPCQNHDPLIDQLSVDRQSQGRSQGQSQGQSQGHRLGKQYSTANNNYSISDRIAEISQIGQSPDRRYRNNKIRELQDFVKNNLDLAKRDYDSYKNFYPEKVTNLDPVFVELEEIYHRCEDEVLLVKTTVDSIRQADMKK